MVIELGKEEYHLELVHEAGNESITAYILDGELEKFVRLPLKEFTVTVQGEAKRRLEFVACENRATGETVGDTSEFTARDSWLKTNTEFDARLNEIKIGNRVYRDVAFNYPKGNE